MMFVLHMVRGAMREDLEIRSEIDRRISKMLSPALF